MIENIWFVPLGFVAGLIGSMIGLGGGIIIVPILTFLGYPHTLAASNSLFAAFSNAVASTISYSRQKRIDYKFAIKLGILTIPGTILGAFVSKTVTPVQFQLLFAALLVASSLYFIKKREFAPKSYRVTTKMSLLAVTVSFFAGVISSFFGIGGGIVFVPFMVILIGIPMMRAAPTSQLILLFATFSGMITHSVFGHPDYFQAVLLMTGSFSGAILGSKLSVELKEKGLRIMVALTLVTAAIKLIYDSLDFT